MSMEGTGIPGRLRVARQRIEKSRTGFDGPARMLLEVEQHAPGPLPGSSGPECRLRPRAGTARGAAGLLMSPRRSSRPLHGSGIGQGVVAGRAPTPPTA